MFFGGLFYFRSEGLVLSEPAVVAAEFPATVRSLMVPEGERVAAGSVAAIVTSQNVIENIARLTAELATREARLAELRIRKQTIEAIMGVAENRQSVAADTRKEFEKLLDRGYLALDKRAAAVDSEFRSRQDFESLKAEKRVIDGEIAILSRTSPKRSWRWMICVGSMTTGTCARRSTALSAAGSPIRARSFAPAIR